MKRSYVIRAKQPRWNSTSRWVIQSNPNLPSFSYSDDRTQATKFHSRAFAHDLIARRNLAYPDLNHSFVVELFEVEDWKELELEGLV